MVQDDGSLWAKNGVEPLTESRLVKASDELSVEFLPTGKRKMIYQFTTNGEVQIWFQQGNVDLTPRLRMLTPKLAEEEVVVLKSDSPVIFRVCNGSPINVFIFFLDMAALALATLAVVSSVNSVSMKFSTHLAC
ncbi:unnamed protein product [Strongylus vulgaris]|uniref:Uncharacterized protein n=1 Tax=Strongylus vulgaris TaxID=40348 RepID=A0A3P7K993_STRVU|nr:unnamed protein product [Strongylus vulgaris]